MLDSKFNNSIANSTAWTNIYFCTHQIKNNRVGPLLNIVVKNKFYFKFILHACMGKYHT